MVKGRHARYVEPDFSRFQPALVIGWATGLLGTIMATSLVLAGPIAAALGVGSAWIDGAICATPGLTAVLMYRSRFGDAPSQERLRRSWLRVALAAALLAVVAAPVGALPVRLAALVVALPVLAVETATVYLARDVLGQTLKLKARTDAVRTFWYQWLAPGYHKWPGPGPMKGVPTTRVPEVLTPEGLQPSWVTRDLNGTPVYPAWVASPHKGHAHPDAAENSRGDWLRAAHRVARLHIDGRLRGGRMPPLTDWDWDLKPLSRYYAGASGSFQEPGWGSATAIESTSVASRVSPPSTFEREADKAANQVNKTWSYRLKGPTIAAAVVINLIGFLIGLSGMIGLPSLSGWSGTIVLGLCGAIAVGESILFPRYSSPVRPTPVARPAARPRPLGAAVLYGAWNSLPPLMTFLGILSSLQFVYQALANAAAIGDSMVLRRKQLRRTGMTAITVMAVAGIGLVTAGSTLAGVMTFIMCGLGAAMVNVAGDVLYTGNSLSAQKGGDPVTTVQEVTAARFGGQAVGILVVAGLQLLLPFGGRFHWDPAMLAHVGAGVLAGVVAFGFVTAGSMVVKGIRPLTAEEKAAKRAARQARRVGVT